MRHELAHSLAHLLVRLLLCCWTLLSALFVLSLLDFWFASLRLMRESRARQWWLG